MPRQMKAKKNAVTVRMYRPGLGDCFLLAFRGSDAKPRYMMIDCGVLLGTKNATEKMTDIAKHINDITNGHLHVLAVTHEHWDHISGFGAAQEIFEQMKIDEVWMGWTEDPTNPEARQLARRKKFYLRALELAASQLKARKLPEADAVEGLLGFYGFGLRQSTNDIMKNLHNIGDSIRYCFPGGEPLSVPGVDSVRVYVLGPPESAKRLRKSRPSRSKHKKETYLTDVNNEVFDIFATDMFNRFGAAEDKDYELPGAGSCELPFDERFQISRDEAAGEPFFKQCYYESDASRKIDDTWMEQSSELALKLDSHTNNTSLVLAVEIVKTGKILLFTGDAQVGNWLSWHDVEWSVDEWPVAAQDLLERVVLYKVGHHGSHNATLRDQGLEMMTSPELAAMIPVSRDMAKRKKWKMPFPPLYKRLRELCNERVIRLDDDIPGIEPRSTGDAKAWKAFERAVTVTDDYIEYVVD